MGWAKSTRDIHLFAGEVIPEDAAGFEERLIARFSGNIGCAGVEISSADGVPGRGLLFPQGGMGLAVMIALGPELGWVITAFSRFNVEEIGRLTALINKILG